MQASHPFISAVEEGQIRVMQPLILNAVPGFGDERLRLKTPGLAAPRTSPRSVMCGRGCRLAMIIPPVIGQQPIVSTHINTDFKKSKTP
jgi:hypothetical protein